MDYTRSLGLNICGRVHLMMNFLITLSVKMSVESVRWVCFLVMEMVMIRACLLSPLGSDPLLAALVVCFQWLHCFLITGALCCPSYLVAHLCKAFCNSYYWLASCVELLFQNETEMISSNNKKGAIITAVVWNHTEYCTLSLYLHRAVFLC